LTAPTLESLISIMKDQVSSKELKTVIKAISGADVTKDDTFSDCRDVLSALRGDIVAMSKIVDKLSNNDIHFRSLIASLITG
jgi:two-component sensor histidine kinase